MKRTAFRATLFAIVFAINCRPAEPGWLTRQAKGIFQQSVAQGIQITGGILSQGLQVAGKRANKILLDVTTSTANLDLMTDDELKRTSVSIPFILRNITFVMPKISGPCNSGSSDCQWSQASELKNLPLNAYVREGAGTIRVTYPFNDTGDATVVTADGATIVQNSWNVSRFFILVDNECIITSTSEVYGELNYNQSAFGEDDFDRPSMKPAGKASLQYACTDHEKTLEFAMDSPLQVCEIDLSDNPFATFILSQDWYREQVALYGDTFKVFSATVGGDAYLAGCKGAQRLPNSEMCLNARSELEQSSHSDNTPQFECSVQVQGKEVTDVADIPSYPDNPEIAYYTGGIKRTLFVATPHMLETPLLVTGAYEDDLCLPERYMEDIYNTSTIRSIYEELRNVLTPEKFKFINTAFKFCYGADFWSGPGAASRESQWEQYIDAAVRNKDIADFWIKYETYLPRWHYHDHRTAANRYDDIVHYVNYANYSNQGSCLPHFSGSRAAGTTQSPQCLPYHVTLPQNNDPSVDGLVKAFQYGGHFQNLGATESQIKTVMNQSCLSVWLRSDPFGSMPMGDYLKSRGHTISNIGGGATAENRYVDNCHGSHVPAVTYFALPLTVGCCVRDYKLGYTTDTGQLACIASQSHNEDAVTCSAISINDEIYEPNPAYPVPVLDLLNEYTGLSATGIETNDLEGLQDHMRSIGYEMICDSRGISDSNLQDVSGYDGSSAVRGNHQHRMAQGRCNEKFMIQNPHISKNKKVHPLKTKVVRDRKKRLELGPTREQIDRKYTSLWESYIMQRPDNMNEMAIKMDRNPESFEMHKLFAICRKTHPIGKKFKTTCEKAIARKMLSEGVIHDYSSLRNKFEKMDMAMTLTHLPTLEELEDNLRSEYREFDIELWEEPSALKRFHYKARNI